ncbi:hypothetical protein CK217_31600 [Mesorhizobium loti]|nr:hypothetical protein CK217_31600 [Mesorhizobium loti]PBB83296.1 hypothetical protein CK216_29780 [Mesorhizobium sp. WSM3876]
MIRVGGALAIAAVAYGTETSPAVDKIVGPGNPWSTKQNGTRHQRQPDQSRGNLSCDA